MAHTGWLPIRLLPPYRSQKPNSGLGQVPYQLSHLTTLHCFVLAQGVPCSRLALYTQYILNIAKENPELLISSQELGLQACAVIPVCLFVCFWGGVSPCSGGWPETHFQRCSSFKEDSLSSAKESSRHWAQTVYSQQWTLMFLLCGVSHYYELNVSFWSC